MRANTARSLRPAACGLALRCPSGLVVVTQKGDRDDQELYPGDEFRTSSRGLVVAWAILDSGFIVRTDTGALGMRLAAFGDGLQPWCAGMALSPSAGSSPPAVDPRRRATVLAPLR